VALLNYTSSPQTIDLGGAYERLRIPGSTEFDGAEVTAENVPPWDGRILLRAGTQRVPRGKLLQNKPNPFNPGTRIDFQLLAPESVHLAVYDIRGRLVRVLLDAPLPAGDAAVNWDGTDHLHRPVHSGIYIYRLETPSFSESKKMTLVR
jgi:flagellar hook capping protein FlgD